MDSAGTSLESFVAQLHDEGIEAGRREAEELVGRAREEAESLIRHARAESDALLAEAREKAAAERARGRAELELASRDVVLTLQAALSEMLRAVLARAARAHLADPAVLSSLLEEVVRAYARADAGGRPSEVRVPRRLSGELEAWWVRELAAELAGHDGGPRLSAVLEEAGFEYRVGDGTVEVSVDSVVETLMGLVRPGLRDLLAEAAESVRAGHGRGAE